jgi:GNAT superfamily N-acetyltransferase
VEFAAKGSAATGGSPRRPCAPRSGDRRHPLDAPVGGVPGVEHDGRAMPPTPASAPASTPPSTSIRFAAPEDVPTIHALIRALAVYERLEHQVAGTPEDLQRHLFGPRPYAEALVAQASAADTIVGFALFFHNFSTFLARPGLYLEDLFVLPSHRRQGHGRALFHALARIAVARGCGRFEWSVLDWNEPAIAFYRSIGAPPMPDWRICRITGEALESLAR